jgi:aldehyde dehydrogenase (NAD(P)+)
VTIRSRIPLISAGTFRTFSFSTSQRRRDSTRSRMEVELTAPNGKKWTQPLGLFINNEFVKSSNGQTITSINPACVTRVCITSLGR